MKDTTISPEIERSRASLQPQLNATPRILLVDDDASTRELNTLVLTLSGYEVDAAIDGAAGWEALQAKPYDLLITDNSMPKVTGVEMIKMLRAAHMALPVIMATRTLPTEELTRHPLLQPDATLVRPYTLRKMLNTVAEVLRVAYGVREPITPPPDGQNQPSTDDLR